MASGRKTLLIALGAVLAVAMVVRLGYPAGDSPEAPLAPTEPVSRGARAAADTRLAAEPAAARSQSQAPHATPDFVLEDLAPATVEPDPRFVIAGRVVWEDDGMPVIGCAVSATTEDLAGEIPGPEERLDRDAAGDLPAGLRVVVTDREGRFELAAVPPRNDTLLHLELPGGGIDLQELSERPERDRVVWQGDFTVRRRGTITGTVVDAEGKPVAAVAVRMLDAPRFDDEQLSDAERRQQYGAAHRLDPRGAFASRLTRERLKRLVRPHTESDARGRFLLEHVPSGQVTLALTHPGRGGRQLQVALPAERRAELGRITLDPAQLLAIRLVESPDGPPVPGHQLALRHRSLLGGTLPRSTDQDGRAWFTVALPNDRDDDELERRLRRVPQEERDAFRRSVRRTRRSDDIDVRHRRRPGDPWVSLGTVSRLHQENGEETEFVVPALRRLDVLVTGQPADGATPQVLTRPRSASARHQPLPGGGVRMTGLPPGGDCLVLQYPGHAPVVLDWPTELDTTKTVTLRPTFAVEVLAQDRTGRPLADAAIDIAFGILGSMSPRDPVPGCSWDRLETLRLGRTDQDGSLLATALWAAPARFRVRHPRVGTSDWTRVDMLQPGLQVVLREQGVGTVSGRLLQGALPVERRYIVELAPNRRDPAVSGHRSRSTTSRADGAYELFDVPAGNWIVTVRDAAWRPVGRFLRPNHDEPASADLMPVQAGRELAVDLDLQGPEDRAELTGTVRGHPPGDLPWRIRLRSRPHPFASKYEQTVTTTPSAQGRFTIATLPRNWDRVIELQILGPFGWERWNAVQHAAGEAVVIDLQHGGMTLALFDQHGLPLACRNVVLRHGTDEQQTETLLRVTTADGTLDCDALPVGDYSIQISNWGQISNRGGAAPDFSAAILPIRPGQRLLRQISAASD